MGYEELIEKLKSLPEDKRAEVFDFVEFLASRFGQPTAESDWTDKEFAQFSLAQALRDAEENAVEYTVEDLKERWQ